MTHFLKLPGGVTFLPVKDLSTLEMTWNVGASYFFCKSGYFATSSLPDQLPEQAHHEKDVL